MSAIIATQLSRIKFFNYIRANPFLLRQMQSVAVAVGVATCFGAPVGGVLFSIEVTSTVFAVSNLWKCFYGSAWAIVMFRSLHEIASISTFDQTSHDETQFGPALLLFIVLGTLCGLMAALFLFMFIKAQEIILKLHLQQGYRRYILIVTVMFGIGILAYPFYALRISDRQISNEMFDKEGLMQNHWETG
eukprot:CAMPEP_0167806124 /NCGR_PEP_ID=MMETSP0111_2-20121227/21617_1 /TAXON_ID=91324 /ORGANISM="Lotharella globosa, Strain CCCM811" /LENGTH=189 /DNA_ID=CAMNT_0007703469 /DNA_START=87 /DNA_END=652 /DNA_ORIENTATION=+